MRAVILIAVAALALAGCNKSGSADKTTNVDQALADQNVSANDTTAIDAATGDDANMAADVHFTTNESLDDSDKSAKNSN